MFGGDPDLHAAHLDADCGGGGHRSVLRFSPVCSPDDYFEAHTKYLQLADKATRTVALLTERLDQHRGRGQQQIVVKHVTVNADQAVVTDTVVTGKPAVNAASPAAVLTDATENPMPTLDETMKLEPVGGTKKK